MTLITETILFTQYTGRMFTIYSWVLFLFDVFSCCENEHVAHSRWTCSSSSFLLLLLRLCQIVLLFSSFPSFIRPSGQFLGCLLLNLYFCLKLFHNSVSTHQSLRLHAGWSLHFKPVFRVLVLFDIFIGFLQKKKKKSIAKLWAVLMECLPRGKEELNIVCILTTYEGPSTVFDTLFSQLTGESGFISKNTILRLSNLPRVSHRVRRDTKIQW